MSAISGLQQIVMGTFQAVANNPYVKAVANNPYVKTAGEYIDENKLHGALAVAFGIVLCRNNFYVNVGCVSAGIYLQQKRNNDVKFLSDTVVAGCYKNKAIFLASLIAAFALSRICGWKVASIGFGYYLSSQYLPQSEGEKKTAEEAKKVEPASATSAAAGGAPSSKVDGPAQPASSGSLPQQEWNE